MRCRPDRKFRFRGEFGHGWELPLETRQVMTASPIASATATIGVTPTSPAVLTANEAWSRTFAITGTNATPIWSLAAGVPEGVAIDSRSGLLTWTPQASHAGQSFSIRVSARYGNSSSSVVSANVELNVAALAQTPAPQPPTIASVLDLQVIEGQSISVRIEATSDSIPAERLRFELIGEDTDGAVIDPVSGVFEWRSTSGDQVRWFGVRVFDAQNPEIASEIHFPIKVLTGSNSSFVIFGGSERNLERPALATKPVAALAPLPRRSPARVKPVIVTPPVQTTQQPTQPGLRPRQEQPFWRK